MSTGRKSYYKHDAESLEGPLGVVYFEFTDDVPTRQVEVYPHAWYRGDESRLEFLADQPFEVMGLEPEHQIDAAEFERVWAEALVRCP